MEGPSNILACNLSRHILTKHAPRGNCRLLGDSMIRPCGTEEHLMSQSEGRAAAPVPPRIINTSQLSLRQQKRFIEEKKVCTAPKPACLLTWSLPRSPLYHACIAEELPHTDNTRANAWQAIIYDFSCNDNFCSRGKQIIAPNRSSRPRKFSIPVLIRKSELMQVRDQFLYHTKRIFNGKAHSPAALHSSLISVAFVK